MCADEAPSGVRPEELALDQFWKMSLDLLCIAGPDGYFKHLNPSWERVLGYRLEELLSRPYVEFVHPDDLQATAEAASTLVDGADVVSFVNRYRHADGGYRWLLWNSTTADETGQIYAVAHDITEQRLAEDSRARLAKAVETSGEAILITRRDGTIVYANAAFESQTGYTRDEALGQTPRLLRSELTPTSRYEELWAAILSGRLWRGQLVNRRRDGTVYVARTTIAPVRDAAGEVVEFVATQQDITGELELQTELVRAQTLQAAGRLTRGVAHDFRNILAAVQACLPILEGGFRSLSDGAKEYLEILGEVRLATERGTELVSRLMSFGAGADDGAAVAELADIVADVAAVSRRTHRSEVEIVTELQANRTQVRMPPVPAHQVVLNLVVNACDAIADGGRVRIRITEPVAAAALLAVGLVADRPYLALTVKDDGEGIAEDDLARIFEPGFTTKQERGGSGVGLGVVLATVQEVGGAVTVESKLGRGTLFTIFLPLADDSTDGEPGQPVRERRRTILLVIPNDAQRRSLALVLTANGYRVLVAKDGPEAVVSANHHPGRIDLVLAERDGDALGGLALSDRVLQHRPATKILLVTDLSDAPPPVSTILGTTVPQLVRPFDIEELLGTVRSALSG